MEIYVKQLDKKFNVPTSNSNVRRVLYFQKAFAAMNNLSGKTDEEVFDAQIKGVDEASKFAKEVLKMKPKEVEKLDEMVDDNDRDLTVVVANYVSQRLMGMSDEQIETGQAKATENPKK